MPEIREAIRMTYQVGGVTVQGDEPSNVIYAAFTPKVGDGAKARILRRRRTLGLEYMFHGSTLPDDLAMGHADPEDTRPSELA